MAEGITVYLANKLDFQLATSPARIWTVVE